MSAFTVLFTTRVWQMAVINLVGIGLILLGLGVFGLAPALVAGLWAAQRLDSQSASELAKGMWEQFRAEALRANLVAGPAMMAAVGFGGLAAAGGVLAPLWVALLAMAGLFASAALVTLSRLSGTIKDGWANASSAASLAPYRLLASVLVVPLIGLVALWQPFLGLYFLLSSWALFTNLVVLSGLAFAMPTSPSIITREALS